mmetsp:Transcript_19976/g.57243  ORF Transcript_19976/g.57243 Transcript_19976/m.57243 type:complete len:151 (+) Transcript_19976:164-616(+)
MATDPKDEPNHEPPGFVSSPRVMFIARWLELLWGYGVTRFCVVFTGWWVMRGGRWAVQAINLVLKWVFGVTSPPKPIDGKHHLYTLNYSHFCALGTGCLWGGLQRDDLRRHQLQARHHGRQPRHLRRRALYGGCRRGVCAGQHGHLDISG